MPCPVPVRRICVDSFQLSQQLGFLAVVYARLLGGRQPKGHLCQESSKQDLNHTTLVLNPLTFSLGPGAVLLIELPASSLSMPSACLSLADTSRTLKGPSSSKKALKNVNELHEVI